MAHNTTRSAFDALCKEEKAFWEKGKQYFYPYREGGSLGETDWYNTHTATLAPERWKQVLPYAYEIMGKSFHNFPVEMETSESEGSWQTNTERNWRWAMQGFDYYVSSTVRCLKEGRFKDACGFLGWLFHVFQDGCGFWHALEGAGGMDPTIFRELFSPPPDRPYRSPVSFLSESTPDVDIRGYKPLLLGTSIAEATFHLYHRYRQTNRHSRLLLVPLVQSSYAGDEAKEQEIRASIAVKVSELLSDIFHTVYCLAREEFPPEEAARLEKVDMTELFPVDCPNHMGGPYWWTAMTKGCSLVSKDETVPLRLFLEEDDKKEKVTFETGLGTGAHYKYVISYGIPRCVYERVELAVGLHAELSSGIRPPHDGKEQGHIEVVIKLDEELLFRKEFLGGSAGERLSLDVSRGGILRLIVRALTKYYANPNNQVVWGAPFLLKE